MGRAIDADKLCVDLMERWDIADKQKEELVRQVMADIVTPIVVSQPTIEPEPQWIPVSEKLPEPYVDVIVTNGIGILYIGWIDPTDKGWRVDSESEYFMKDIIAWMPRPKEYRDEQE